MADNMIQLVAGLDTQASEDLIKQQLKTIGANLSVSQALKIKCSIDTNAIADLKTQLGDITKSLTLNVGGSGETTLRNDSIVLAAKAFENANTKALTLKKTLSDLSDQYTKPFKAVFDSDGFINAERTMAKIQSRLSSLGAVTVEGKYDDGGAADSLYKITATIKATNGEIRSLNFLLDDTDDKFKLLSSSYNDKGVEKVQQDLARLSKELANFEASHKSIINGLTEPLTQARNSLIELEQGTGSVEAVQKALNNLKTEAANIGSNLKSTGASFNIFDNAANKAQNFDNIIKALGIDVGNLSASSQKSALVSQLDTAISRLTELRAIEESSGRGLEWSKQYKELSALIQNITNNLSVAQKEERAFNKEFERELSIEQKINAAKEKEFNKEFNKALKEEEKEVALKQQKLDLMRQIRNEEASGKVYGQSLSSYQSGEFDEQTQRDYWDDKRQETIKAMTAENQVLKDMKKYYEDLEKSITAAEKAKSKLAKEDSKLETVGNRIKKLTADMNAFAVANRRAVESSNQMSSGKTFAETWNDLQSRMSRGADLTADEVKHLGEEFRIFGKEAEAAGLKGQSAFGKFLESFKTMSSYITANMVFSYVKREIREMVNEVITIDTAMVELRKVTEATNEQFEEFAKSAGKTGRELGASISDVINATSTFSRAGFNLEDAEELGRIATLYKNVGDGIDIDGASESIISVMKAFNIEASEAERIIDRINQVSNNFAIDSQGLGFALQRVASAMDAANNSLDETIALTTVSNEIVQNPEMVAQGWRTVALRIRGAKAELEDAGLETEGMVESTAKLRDLIKQISGVDIMLDDSTFKSTYQIIEEIGKAWKDISDVNQAALLEAIAGKRQSNIVAAALNNYERLDDVLKKSVNSTGSAMREQEEYAKAIQYSLNTFKAAFQDLAQTTITPEFIKGLVGAAQSFLEVLTKIVGQIGAIPAILAAITTINAIRGKGKPKNMPIYVPLQLCA